MPNLVMLLPNGRKWDNVPISSILYVVCDKRLRRLVTAEREYRLSSSLEAIEAQLPKLQFVRTHKSCIVSVSYISSISKPLTPEQQIREAVAYATITPQAIELLDKFFQDTATGPDKDELDEWLHISPANDQLFELLLLLNIKPAGPGTISRVKKLLLPEA